MLRHALRIVVFMLRRSGSAVLVSLARLFVGTRIELSRNAATTWSAIARFLGMTRVATGPFRETTSERARARARARVRARSYSPRLV